MRCLTCGEEMVLAEAMPAEGAVQGFENRAHRCSACGTTERRFMFVGGKSTPVDGRAEMATLASAPHRMNVKVSRGGTGAHKTAVNQPSGIKLHISREESRIIASAVFDALRRANVLLIDQPGQSNL